MLLTLCLDMGVCMQASQTPSKDLSQREVAAAQRLTEHALFLQRRQRTFLARLGAMGARLRSLAATLSDFSAAADAPAHVPSQVWHWCPPLNALFVLCRLGVEATVFTI